MADKEVEEEQKQSLLGKQLPPYKRPTRVPNWFYKEDAICGLTKAAFIWICNLIAMFAHTGFAIASVVMATRDGKTMATPRMTIYLTNLTWVNGTSDALVPTFTPVEGLYLAHMTLWFFLLSALAHAFVVFLNFRQAFAVVDNRTVCCFKTSRDVGYWSGYYYIWIHQCRMPHRWLEYSVSASLMALVFAVVGGINHVYMLSMMFALMFCTMLFGYFAEVLCRPLPNKDENARPLYWAMNKYNPQLLAIPHLLVFRNLDYMSARLHRLGPHLVGYVPYLTVWICLLHSFLYNLEDAQSGGVRPPDFVYAIIVGQCVTFSLFGITQLVLLSRVDGARGYYWGEVSYQTLSLVAKGLLGGILIANVLLFDSFEEAVDDAS